MALADLLKSVDFEKLKKTRNTVLVVGAFSPQTKLNKTWKRQIIGDRDAIYDDFVNTIQPRLAEIEQDNSAGIKGIMKLDVPGPKTENHETFVIDRHNYFFKRGASESEHEFHKEKFGDGTNANWLSNDRGKKFVIELRKHLKDFCKFQHRNREVLIFLMKVLNEEGIKGFGGISGGLTLNRAFPPGVAEEILDFLYHAPENVTEKALAEWLPFTELEGLKGTHAEDDTCRKSLRTVVHCFRDALLLKGPPGACSIGGPADAYGKTKEKLDASLSNDFGKARSAIKAIQEILPCHVLPQDSILWVFKEMFRLVNGRELNGGLLDEEQDKLAEAINNGFTDEATGRRVKAPDNKVLDDAERRKTRDNVRDNLDLVVDLVFEPTVSLDTVESDELKQVVESLRNDEDCQKLVRSFLPSESPDFVLSDALKGSMKEGAKKFFKIIFLSKVAPKMFSMPNFELDDLESQIAAYEIASILASTALNAGEGELNLDKLGDGLAGKISSALKADNFAASRTGIEADAAGGTFREIAKQLGPCIQGQLDLWRIARDLLKGRESTEDTFASSLGATRADPKAKEDWSIDKSKIAYPKNRITAMVRSKLELEVTKTELVEQVASLKELVEKKEEEAEAVKVTISNRESEKNKLSENEAQKPEEVEENLKAARAIDLEIQAEKDRLSNLGQLITGSKDAIEEKNKKFEGLSNEGKSQGNEARIDQIFDQFQLKQSDPNTPNSNTKRDDDLDLTKIGGQAFESRVQAVVEEFMGSAGQVAQAEDALLTAEYVRNRIFKTYAEHENIEPSTSFRRNVEAMVLAKAMRAAHRRVGMGGKSSGLLKAMLHLTELTGLRGDDEADAFELLSQKPLQEYLDGAFLQQGVSVGGIITTLKNAASASFENIGAIVSELHGVYHLIHSAEEGTTIEVYNGTAEKCRLDIIASHMKSGGGPFGKQNNDRPGLIHLTNLAFPGNTRVGELKNWSDLKLQGMNQRFLIPPVVLSSRPIPEADDWKESQGASEDALEGAVFPWVICGPDHFLNNREDKEFATSLPSGYSFLAGFLGAKDLALSENSAIAVEFDDSRLKTLSAATGGDSIDKAVNRALFETSNGHNFSADYFLFVVAALRMGTEASDKNGQTLLFHFHNAAGSQYKSLPKGLKETMVDSSQIFYFPGGGPMVKWPADEIVVPDAQTATDLDWFYLALKSMGLGLPNA